MKAITKLKSAQEKGFLCILRRRLNWYLMRLRVNNLLVGRLVEVFGNKVWMDGLTYSVDTPNISTRHKSTIFFGLHEIEERALIKRWLPRHLPVIELGGGIGVVSCLTSKLLDNPNKHLVIEANPHLIPVLERNGQTNKAQYKIVNAAVMHDAEIIDLPIDPEFVGSSATLLQENRETISVKATTVTAEANQAGFGQFSLIADIEGAEDQVITNELPLLGERLRFLMLEMHPYVLGDNRVEELMSAIESQGFVLRERLGQGSVFCVAYSRD